MKQQEYIQQISSYLSRLSEYVKILNNAGDFSINKYAENIILTLLNEIYGLSLVNVNAEEKNQYPAIDLRDKAAGVAIQVTSTGSSEKIKETIDKYFRHGIYRETGTLIIFIITEKQKTRATESIQAMITEWLNKLNDKNIVFNFDIDTNIRDRSDLIRELIRQNDTVRLGELKKKIAAEFETLVYEASLSPYYEKLKNMYYEPVLNDDNGLTLDKIYIEPSFSVISWAFPDNDQRIVNYIFYPFIPIRKKYSAHEFLTDYLENQNPLRLKGNFRFRLLLGYPGQGKSSFCKRFINDYLRKNEEIKTLYYFPLREITRAKEFVDLPLTVLQEEISDQLEQEIDRWKFQKSFLVLDGLDELYMKDGLRIDDIDRLCMELCRLVDKHEELEILLTSRYGYVDLQKFRRQKMLVFELALLNKDRQIEWLEKYRVYHPETWLTDDLLRRYSGYHYSHVNELIQQPLLLHMVASLKRPLGENTNRSALYEQMFSELIERRYSAGGQLQIFGKVTPEDLRNLVREIAFAIFQSGNEYISKSALLKLEGTKRFLDLMPEEGLKDSIKGVMIAFYFKETLKKHKESESEDKSYAIEFLHKSLREYMTAEKICADLVESFTESSNRGRFFIDEAIPAIKKLRHLFGSQALTSELISHIQEIIKKHSDEQLKVFRERFLQFFDRFLEMDFYIAETGSEDEPSIIVALRIFTTYIKMIGIIGWGKDYLDDLEKRNKFLYLLQLASFKHKDALLNLDFSHQNLSNIEFIGTNYSHCTFDSTIFYNSKIIAYAIRDSKFANARFMNTELRGLYSTTDFEKCIFQDSNFNAPRMQSIVFRDCTFTNTIFTISEMTKASNIANPLTFENCTFTNILVDKGTLFLLEQNSSGFDFSNTRILIEEEEEHDQPVDPEYYTDNDNETEDYNYKEVDSSFIPF